jgi:DNA-binding XRE family transcriptional regulator
MSATKKDKVKINLDAIGTLIMDYRKRIKMTQQELAEQVGVHRYTIQKIEANDLSVSYKYINMCLIALDLNDKIFLTINKKQ